MKKIIIYIIGLTLFAACSQASTYKITGDIIGVQGKIYLTHSGVKMDSTDLVEGKFTFTGSVKSPQPYHLTFADNRRVGYLFFL